jgi:hypothetical protein
MKNLEMSGHRIMKSSHYEDMVGNSAVKAENGAVKSGESVMKLSHSLLKPLAVAACAVLACSGASAYETPTMGWSSWNTYGCNISEELIKAQADAMVSTGLKDAGYQYINIDDGMFAGRDDAGNLKINTSRFPNGLKPVVVYIHSKGLKAGSYSDAGYNTCASYFGGDVLGKGTGLYEHDQQDIDFMFKDTGFDFIKVDFCGGSPGHNEDKLDLDEQERYTAIHQAMVNTGIDGLRLNVCRWDYPGTWVENVATSWRISQDIYLGWASVKDIIGQTLYLSAYATEGRFNDMDMLEVGRGLSNEEDKTHFGMWCMLSSPLLMGCDLTTIKDETVALVTNRELLALNQDPLALQAYVVNRENGVYLLVKDVETLRGTTRAIAVYNPSNTAGSMTVNFRDVDLGGSVAVRDLFEQQDLGDYTGSFTVDVPAHGTRIYKLTAENRYERSVYEAETAWISDYQELDNNQLVETGVYEEGAGFSGGAKAGWLGRKSNNDLQWRDVYSENGGDYTMSIAFISGEDRVINVDVNGETVTSFTVNSGGWSTVATKEIPVTLKPGVNVVRLWNDSAWMPDIDCMKLLSPDAITTVLKNAEKSTVDVYTISGILVAKNLQAESATPDTLRNTLAPGIYVVNGEKIEL